MCFLNTVPLVCGIDASIKICISSNMDNNTTTSANICSHIFILVSVLVLRSVSLSVLTVLVWILALIYSY